ncbi:MAG: tRNA-I(6)A37 thiotransferase enzyme MiaB [Candidatus Curtissbacteria bacterium GW2011_GWA1_41_11]|uniref:tRNA-2-methylthio-N(6)-dimethylallyladenosine synthase n=1 Tax=Candidatus Curtissbacteria bacterium GW2011_GWA1_41_11 TaxID=1618409 RepID=A0A0G0XJ61_9BACT|nr:MAG: tRNA-I(6)A37 thiotransferase enzyme MiaB [Candidatus Curtissbacteria bacterium GW2011_GWA1_41_11]
MKPSFFIKTFGCQQNVADSQRIASYYLARGYRESQSMKSASEVVINTCMIRQSAEDRVTGLVKNIAKDRNPKPKIVITGCMVGMAARDETGKYLSALKKRMPEADDFLPLDEVGFDYPALRNDVEHAWVPISNGCNNFCTFCVVPFTRGREVSRPFKDIIDEIKEQALKGCREVTLLGQNVNSYGADLVKKNTKGFKLPTGRRVKPVLVKHLGRFRIPTLFPYLLEEVCKIKGIKTVKFISSNPWDFSDELIDVIAKNPKIDRNIHLAVQSGDDDVLKRMNRWYTRDDYLKLVNKIKNRVKGAQISTDIIVGFPGETKNQFENTVKLAKAANFAYAYVAKYSSRPNTAATKSFPDNVPHQEKDVRFHILNELINRKGSPRTAVH